jgi:glutaredoxin
MLASLASKFNYRSNSQFRRFYLTIILVTILTLTINLPGYSQATPSPASTPTTTKTPTFSPIGQPTPAIGWQITTTSGKPEIQLAQHLKKIGAKIYVAWWCPHCHEQKQLFGKQAFTIIPAVECAEDGKNARPELCKAAKIKGFPTWIIKGKQYSGTTSLQKLAEISNYKDSRKFKNFPNAIK